MIRHFSNFLILKSDETEEEHLARIVDYDLENKKMRLSLIDNEKNKYYRRDKNIKVLIPANKDLYNFKSNILYFDIIERIMTIKYPDEIEIIHRRKNKRYPFKLPIEIEIGDTVVPSVTFDISLGGLSFAVKTTKICQIDDYIKINFCKTSQYLGGIWGKIVNHRESIYKGNTLHLYGAEFEDLDDRMLNKLILFLNENNIKSHF